MFMESRQETSSRIYRSEHENAFLRKHAQNAPFQSNLSPQTIKKLSLYTVGPFFQLFWKRDKGCN
jgi:hypothetical protein